MPAVRSAVSPLGQFSVCHPDPPAAATRPQNTSRPQESPSPAGSSKELKPCESQQGSAQVFHPSPAPAEWSCSRALPWSSGNTAVPPKKAVQSPEKCSANLPALRQRSPSAESASRTKQRTREAPGGEICP